MATMTLKSTFTLDKDTNEAIRNLALNWKVSQAEVVRKSIQLAMKKRKRLLQRKLQLSRK